MAARRRNEDANASPSSALGELAKQAVEIAKKGRRHRKSLSGDNYYANRLSELKSQAAEAFAEFSAQSTGDATALAELIEIVFSPRTDPKERLAGQRELALA